MTCLKPRNRPEGNNVLPLKSFMGAGLHPGVLLVPSEEFVQTPIRESTYIITKESIFFNLEDLFLIIRLLSKPKRLFCYSAGKVYLPSPVLLKLKSFQLIDAF